MSNHSNNSKHTHFVEGPLRSLMAPLVLLWSSFSVPFRLLKSVALPSTYLRRTFDVPSTKRLLRAAVLAAMVFGGSVAWGQHPFTLTTPDDVTNHTETLYWMESFGATGFYAIPHTDNSKVSTTNMPNMNALWYFMDAGIESGTQYYYIVNKSTGYYLKLTGTIGNDNTIVIGSFGSGGDAFKFSVGGSEGEWIFYPKSGNGSYWVNKKGGNVPYDKYFKSSNYGGSPDANSKWNFVARNSVTWAHPFTNSTNSEKHYYYIHNAPSNGSAFYMSIDDASDPYATVSNVDNGKRIWYFMEAASDNTIPNFKYYYIVNAVTGKYLKFTGTANGNEQASSLQLYEHDGTETGETENRFQFMVLNAKGGTYSAYSIMPKMEISFYYHKNASLSPEKTYSNPLTNDMKIGIYNDRGTDNNYAHWYIDEIAEVEAPVITYDNVNQEINITCGTAGVNIYYTLDGSTPTASSTPYNGPVQHTSPCTINAIAVKYGLLSAIGTPYNLQKVAMPTVSVNSTTYAVTISCDTPDALIYYAIGSAPVVGVNPYSSPFILSNEYSGQPINAIAVKAGMINSEVGTTTFEFPCAKPVITKTSATTFTITCSYPTSGVTIYYNTGDGNQADPTSASTEYIGEVTFNESDLPFTVKAIAMASGYENSEVATKTIREELTPDGEGNYHITNQTEFETFVDMASSTDGASHHYVLDANVTAVEEIAEPFKGIFDGNYHTITGLSNPLFNTVNGGVVKNVMLKGVAISSAADTVGAITNIATGYSRIYNCGILPNNADFPDGDHPYVRTTGNCAGGLVGSLRNDSRVVNCFSYADVQASNLAAGIVGRNTFASDASETDGKYANLRTMVVNCMFYGNITGGTNQYGVYGGQLITNAAATGINSYNYYSNGSTFTTTSGEPTAYNCSFPAEIRYLTQVEFHRSLLNSNRELCGWWVRSDVAPSTLTTAEVQAIPKDASLMAKWVLDPNIAPYPILKPFGKYPSVINPFTGTPWFDHTQAEPYEGKQLGTLTVHVQSGDHSTASEQILSIPITDMDTLHYDYCYRKVQLPYFNTVFGNPNGATWAEKYAGNYTEYVVTGWKILGVDHEGANPFEAHWEHGYNFADRKCTAKDIYSENNKRIFAQGGNYYVPDGVTEITIEAYWGKAIYVRNNSASYDRVNITLGTTGSDFAPTGTRGNNVNGATIQTTSIKGTLTNANIDAKKTVYDYALVLVGNVQESVSNSDVVHAKDATRGFTIMSVDLDFDEEPDYCLEWQLGKNMARQVISPVRFDFLPIVELGIAGKLHNSTNFFSLGCFRSKGHFEVTETAFIRFGQFEFELGSRDDGPIILNGGIYDQYCRGRNGETNQHINYVIVGGHIVMPSFTPGAHVNSSTPYQTRHCAVNALGGNFTSFYLTGGYNEGVTPYVDNPHCYIDGGHFGTIAAAYKEGIAGNVTWRINHALIGEFYGGGVMAQATGDNYKIVKGSIDVVIDNSIVRKYCGGPKFGDMVTGKTVTTSATGTVFTQYFGAGNGGTNYTQYASTDDSQHGPLSPSTWANTVTTNYHVGQYRSADHSYEADYDIEVINTSTGDLEGRVINRSYYYAAQFATTNTGNVSNTLTGCTVLNNFYGAGFLGGVNGTVTSILNSDTILGSVYGAGYSASAGTVTVYNKDKTPPSANVYTGMIKPQSGGTSSTYYWSHNHGSTGSPATAASPATHDTAYFYTEISLENLGAVSNNVTLVITGNSTIGTVEGGNLVENTGNVFGGGDQSAVTGNTTVYLQDNTQVLGNVYGGGNNGSVNGDSEVVIQDIPVISGTTPFTESTTVTIAGPAGASLYYTIDGSTPTVSSTAYTGSISLDNTTTVKAIAITNGVSSPVVTKTFTKQP